MNFNSPHFLFFLPVVVFSYWLVFRHERWRDILLLLASYYFYMSWDWRYAGLMAFSTLLDYSIGHMIARLERSGPRLALISVTLVTNLGILAVFKYFNFFIDSAQASLGLLGLNTTFPHLYLLLPVGISFYTFQSLSYTLDVYRREIVPERSLLKYALYISFFPQLVAGPIVRACDFLPQMHRTPQVSNERFLNGLALVFRGLIKKVFIADLLVSLAVDDVFANPAGFSSWDLLMALYGYSFQIYNDFSGYSDIAIGSARMLGYELCPNFRRPYASESIREFWTRWHISLSTWLRDYLYISLGGNRCRPWRVKANLLITMLLGGLWHGAAINFVLWGLWHGILLVIEHVRGKPSPSVSVWQIWRRRFLCFHLVVAGWLLFRIPDFDRLLEYLRGLSRFSTGTVIQPLYYIILASAFVIHFSRQSAAESLLDRFARLPVVVQSASYSLVLLALSGFALGTPQFIYFQF